MKLCPMGAELFHADLRTDRHKANSRLFQFCERTYKFELFKAVRLRESNTVLLGRYVLHIRVAFWFRLFLHSEDGVSGHPLWNYMASHT
jgi:hypothetical protein